jgi:phosphoglycerate dehydrogenase-like enzyme
MIAGRTLGIVGYGEIGRSVARRAKAMGMHVLGCRRKPEPDGIADEILTNEQLPDVLRRSHYLVLCTPLTTQTRGMIGSDQIAQMPDDAVLINIGRGPVVVEAALIDALRERRIRGAALDVFDEEPLPPEHPFWDLDNLLLSPHCADHALQ